MTGISPQQIAMGIGSAGAMVDVTSFVKGTEGVAFQWGRQDEFRDAAPGQFSFVLENQDGRFTPDNPSTPLATPVTEGMAVVWQLGTRLTSGVIQSIGFANSEEQWGRVTITCMDMLGVANRTDLTDLANNIASTNAYLFWPFNDPAGSTNAAEVIQGGPSFVPFPIPVSALNPTFGVAPTAPTADTQAQFTTNAANQIYLARADLSGTPFPPIQYAPGSVGFWGFWYTLTNLFSGVRFDVAVAGFSGNFIEINAGSSVSISIGSGSAFTPNIPVANPLAPHYVAVGMSYTGSTTMSGTLYLDGVALQTVSYAVGSAVTNAQLQPVVASLSHGDGVDLFITDFAHLTHSPILLHEEGAGVTTEAQRIAAIAQTVPQFVLGTVDSSLSTAPVDLQSTSGTSALSLLADVMRTEQGQIYCTSSGTYPNATQVVNIRARTRPTTVQASFDAQAELNGVPQFLRDITNMFSNVTASGNTNSATVFDPAAVPRVGSANDSETVVNLNVGDLTLWAEDRLQRGENVNLKIASFTVDTLNVSTPAATLAKIFGLTPGDRIEITNLPSAQLGFSTWDGWFLGMAEVHAPGSSAQDAFTLYCSPVLPASAIFDTNLWDSDGNNTLNASITSTATSVQVVSEDGITFLEQTAVPYTLQIENEQVTVTACGAPSGVVQTATITRHVNGTTAAAHGAGVNVEIVPVSLFAF